MSLRNLMPKETRDLLESKDPTVDKNLGAMRYLVVCDTCGTVFEDATLDLVKMEVAAGKWDLPRMWYVTAARHWLQAHPNCLHVINAYIVYPSGTKAKVEVQGKGRGISEDWLFKLKDPADISNYNAPLMEMSRELDVLEQQIKTYQSFLVE